jgi:GMP synthase-like glutamine amidotransferase
MFSDAFRSSAVKIDWHIFDVTKNEFPSHIPCCDGYLISGSRYSANDNNNWIRSLLDITKRIHKKNIPIVGLCFGLQILAKAFSGKVAKANQGWGIGHKEYKVSQNKTTFNLKSNSRITVPVCHQDQIIELPGNAIRVASSNHCENFIVSFGRHTIGVQGHPEFDDKYIRALIEYKKDELTESEYITALQSHAYPKDSDLLRKIILDFLLGKKAS